MLLLLASSKMLRPRKALYYLSVFELVVHRQRWQANQCLVSVHYYILTELSSGQSLENTTQFSSQLDFSSATFSLSFVSSTFRLLLCYISSETCHYFVGPVLLLFFLFL